MRGRDPWTKLGFGFEELERWRIAWPRAYRKASTLWIPWACQRHREEWNSVLNRGRAEVWLLGRKAVASRRGGAMLVGVDFFL